MTAYRAISTALLAAALAAASPAAAQTQAQPQAPTEVAPMPEPLDPADLPDAPSPTMVEVSLGDWTLKNELASQLGVKVSQIPLTVAVSADLASKACPISSDDLEQQQVISPTRTCAAKTMSNELRDEVGKHLRTATTTNGN